ncbi:MAG TPA: SDR family oxidoreductase [Aestuariivirgaceae bacterium]|nr:SDR family oxidoreductase [Aestuariivirgaceae bacterium]
MSPWHAVDPLFNVAGRNILVAGAAGGLGAPLARALANRGARLMLADMNLDGAENLARELDASDAHACRLDVTDEASCAAAVEQSVERLGGLDIVINATGIYRVAPAVDLALQDWQLTIDVNLTGAFLLARTAGRHMVARNHGRIVTIASVSSEVVNPDYAAYAASKAGVAHLTRVLALEWARFGVTVNAIGPAVIPTPLSQAVVGDDSRRNAAIAKIPMGRLGTPEDLVGAVVLLASDAGAFITGQTLYVDGGRTLL